MNILIINDDSIHAPGIALLAREAAKLGKVWVAAPASQCSAMSHRISIRTTLRATPVPDFDAPVEAAWSITGTPADCVKAALGALLPEMPDVVFSGINDGYNAGYNIAYSGTVSAALEAVMHGIPAIAFSSAARYPLDLPQSCLAEIAQELLAQPAGRGCVWNVNFPAVPQAELKGIARDVSIGEIQDFYEIYRPQPQEDGTVLLTTVGQPTGEDVPISPDSDIAALRQGYISIGRVKSAVM